MPVTIEEGHYVETCTTGCESLQFQIESNYEGRFRVEFETNDQWQVLVDEPIDNGETTFTSKGFPGETNIRLACTCKDENNKECVSIPAGDGTWNQEQTSLFAQWDCTGNDDPDCLDQTVTMTVID